MKGLTGTIKDIWRAGLDAALAGDDEKLRSAARKIAIRMKRNEEDVSRAIRQSAEKIVKEQRIVNTMQITEQRLRTLVRDELKSLREAVDHEGVKTVVTGASKVLKALEAFKSSATPEMLSALDLTHTISTLENMVSNPASYVPKPKVEPKIVKLRSQKEA